MYICMQLHNHACMLECAVVCSLQITKSVVRDLSKSELEELGVTLLGDQKRLRSACNPPPTGMLQSITPIIAMPDT